MTARARASASGGSAVHASLERRIRRLPDGARARAVPRRAEQGFSRCFVRLRHAPRGAGEGPDPRGATPHATSPAPGVARARSRAGAPSASLLQRAPVECVGEELRERRVPARACAPGGRPRARSACRSRTRGAPGGRSRTASPGRGPPVATAMATGSRSPAATICAMAPRSAQIVAPYDAFSTLQPAKTAPLFVRIAAPTWYFEYGA